MDELQSDRKKWCRYYGISSAWVQRWLEYVQQEAGANVSPPGPIDNTPLIKTLVMARENDQSAGKSMFYNVNKHLYMYFVALYGGGPALVQIDLYKRHELQIAGPDSSRKPRLTEVP